MAYHVSLRYRALFLLFAAAASGDTPHFRYDIALVNADARVYDTSTGRAILGLGAEDFVVHDEGQRREIVYVDSDAEPLDLALVLDVSGTMRDVLPRVAGRAGDALTQLRRGDRAAVVAFGKAAALIQPLTGDFRAVAAGILRTFHARVGMDTDLNSALLATAEYLRRDGRRARRAVVAITDNIQASRVSARQVEVALYEADAVLDGLVLTGKLTLPHWVRSRGGVYRFAAKTGGEVIEGRPDERLAEMIERIRSRYAIHFRPADTESDRPRRIRVELSAGARARFPNAAVRARAEYYPRPPRTPAPDLMLSAAVRPR